MDLLQAAALGLLQGATEFLPVSSSGHLVLAGALIGVEPDLILAFGVFLHFATMLAVLAYFAKRFVGLVRVLFVNPVRWIGKKEIPDGDRRLGRLLVGIIIGTLPAVAVGLLFKAQIDEAFRSPMLAAGMLYVTAAILFSLLLRKRGREAREVRAEGDKKDEIPAPSWWRALLVGAAQAVAILPGISRSGATIVAGIHLGEEQRHAAEFSFLLSLPAVLGANLIELGDVISSGKWLSWSVYLVGGLAAFLTGLAAIWVVMRTVRSGRFWLFGIYCAAAATLSLIVG
ncbi:MAG: undecaprenyl-diphosphate phosphatase [bacterium]|nr:undecaprenyl-diphosphate phosphatase [bacterium]